jgi:hypothetical protein
VSEQRQWREELRWLEALAIEPVFTDQERAVGRAAVAICERLEAILDALEPISKCALEDQALKVIFSEEGKPAPSGDGHH